MKTAGITTSVHIEEMVLFKSSNRFSILPVKHIHDVEDEHDSIIQPVSQVLSSPKRTPRNTYSCYSTHKPSLAKLPPFLRIPRELRWMIFDALIASITEIEISPSFIDGFHALRLTTKGLREEVIGWQRKRPDVINAFPYGCFIPHQTTFILKIDHRWKKVVKHKTVSGSHVTFKSGPKHKKPNEGLLPETKAIKYMTREQAWYSFCRTVTPRHMSKMHLKFEISLPEEFEPTSKGNGLSQIPREELFEALAASRYQEGSWASQRLYLQGTIDQLASMYKTDTLAQIGDMVHIVQKTGFDAETWTLFRDYRWEVDDYDSLSYPFDATYWEDEKYKIYKKGRDGKDVYEYGGRVMEAVIESAEDMRRGPPLVAQSSIPPPVNEEDAFVFTRGWLQGTTACL
ncbi:hypothetical protein BCON_0151g00150 [Botryotinia convoluta]|uniref:Uncharacterized protein n=1 Tax=Botryotinia convoluta TaxID=54673 RepID=A0A4Z1HSS8_9HELO|nr:hypothetical protein BCON_0151g00150 [Botryotinia convoluta]